MNEFAFSPETTGCETAEKIHQSSSNTLINPNIAIDDPNHIAFGFPVCSAHIPDLRIGSQIVRTASATGEIRILLLHEYFSVKAGEIGEQALEYWKGGIIARGDAEENRQFGAVIILLEGGGQAIVHSRLNAFDGANNRDMRD